MFSFFSISFAPSVGKAARRKREVQMMATFDIFKVTRGELRWLRAADTIEAAKVRIEERAQTSPGNFVIHNQKTAEAIRVISGNGEKRPRPQQPESA